MRAWLEHERWMKLIVGLGNPGRRYEKTRHNVGFEVLSVVAGRCADGSVKEKFNGNVVDATIAGERCVLLCPHTLMNLSGQSVRAAVDFYQLSPADLLVVCDDFYLPLATLRFRSRGSAGGQKGLGDITRRLGTEELSRLRIGIGPVPDDWEASNFVLGRFTADEQARIDEAITRAADGVECWVAEGIDASMNKFN